MTIPNLVLVELETKIIEKGESVLVDKQIEPKEIANIHVEMADGSTKTLSATRIPEFPNFQIRACAYVEASDMFPSETIKSWFWENFNEVTMGDANRTLITAQDFAKHARDLDRSDLDVEDEIVDQWIEKIQELGDLYIDLEN